MPGDWQFKRPEEKRPGIEWGEARRAKRVSGPVDLRKRRTLRALASGRGSRLFSGSELGWLGREG